MYVLPSRVIVYHRGLAAADRARLITPTGNTIVQNKKYYVKIRQKLDAIVVVAQKYAKHGSKNPGEHRPSLEPTFNVFTSLLNYLY